MLVPFVLLASAGVRTAIPSLRAPGVLLPRGGLCDLPVSGSLCAVRTPLRHRTPDHQPEVGHCRQSPRTSRRYTASLRKGGGRVRRILQHPAGVLGPSAIHLRRRQPDRHHRSGQSLRMVADHGQLLECCSARLLAGQTGSELRQYLCPRDGRFVRGGPDHRHILQPHRRGLPYGPMEGRIRRRPFDLVIDVRPLRFTHRRSAGDTLGTSSSG
jgi:hypothetical protein